MESIFQRTEMLLGDLSALKSSRVAVVGLGGVGGYCVEVLARSGVGTLILVDRDSIDITNINRQIIADTSCVGKDKAEAWAERVRLINPDCNVIALKLFYLPETREDLFSNDPDYVIDAVDNVTAKIDLVCECTRRNIPVISSMGFGNKTDPSQITICDLKQTSVCPLAKVMRHELKKRGIEHVPVCFSTEVPVKTETGTISSVAWVPSVAGIMMGGYVVRDILNLI